jgi:uncharacterized protein YutE (UPF0331/DUF86 family)
MIWPFRCYAFVFLLDLHNLCTTAPKCAQCLIAIGNTITSLEDAQKPRDYYYMFLIPGNLRVLTPDCARQIAPLAGFRKILVHDYVGIDWDLVHDHLQRFEDCYDFETHGGRWGPP